MLCVLCREISFCMHKTDFVTMRYKQRKTVYLFISRLCVRFYVIPYYMRSFSNGEREKEPEKEIQWKSNNSLQ